MSAVVPSLQTAGWGGDDKPLPQLPSPTLSNIDMVLPMNTGLPVVVSSPPRVSRGPPSPGYLRDRGRESPVPNYRHGAVATKEKLGLMSRKMLLLRSRTASGGSSTPRGSPPQGSIDLVPSSPILQDVGNLAPEQSEPESLRLPEPARRRASGSSCSGHSGRTAFFEKYAKAGIASDEDVSCVGSEYATLSRMVGSRRESLEEGADEMRRRQEQEEYESAVLSQRAEQILANAKKRLNVMEGNLRGARDLVQPLTAANLKRATSLSGAIYGNGRTLLYDYDDQQTQSPPRKLHAQQSSPHMGNDYHGHTRNFSGVLPDRPHTSLEHHQQYMPTLPTTQRRPFRLVEQVQERPLRSSRSHDQLGSANGHRSGRSFHMRLSPDQNYLEPLAEDEERKSQRNSQHTSLPSSNNGLGIYRPASRTSDLRDQLSSLKGKISTLKDRAREDSLRRQSQSNLRNPTPFSNAATTPPEMMYSPDPAEDDHANPRANQTDLTARFQPPPIASRNAFAEQAGSQDCEFAQARVVDVSSGKIANCKFQVLSSNVNPKVQPTSHERTASGSAIIGSAKNRYSHYQNNNSQSSVSSQNNPILVELPAAHIAEHEYLGVASPALSHKEFAESSQSSADEALPRSHDDYAPSEAEASIYEDAKEQISVVAHEDREDAFDYEHFFLHSAMGSCSGDRRGSQSSNSSEASVNTARGPALVGYEDDDAFDQFSAEYPAPHPETPEKLREIERNIHQRRFSGESITTMNTFATAEEGDAIYDDVDPDAAVDEEEEPDVSPPSEHITHRISSMAGQHSVSPLPSELERQARSTSRVHYRQQSSDTQASSSTYRASNGRSSHSLPGNSVTRQMGRRDSSSDRADSGVGLSSRHEYRHPSQSGITHKHRGKLSNSSVTSNPPLSSRDPMLKLDPTTVAVQALLDPNGKHLGLRNKAVLFSIVESLRKVARQMQEEDDATFASRMLRNTLDEAKRTLDGL